MRDISHTIVSYMPGPGYCTESGGNIPGMVILRSTVDLKEDVSWRGIHVP